MSKLKIVNTLLTFNKKQTDRLRQFVNSPYFNSGYNAEQLVELLEFLLKHKKKEVDKGALQAQFFPDKPFIDKSKNAIDNPLADLNALVEEFIVHQEVEEEVDRRSSLLKAKYFGRIHREDRFLSLISRYRKQWKKRNRLGFEDWLERFQLELLAAEYHDIFKTQDKESGLQSVHHYLDQFFLAQKMMVGFMAYFQQKVLGKTDAVDMEQDPIWMFLYKNYPQLESVNPVADL